MDKVIIGIDIAKDHLEIAFLEMHTLELLVQEQLPNTRAGYEHLLTMAAPYQVERIVMEATGTYHRALLACLVQARLPLCLLNPLQHRRFSQMKLRRGKTDRIDARSLAQYGHEQKPPLYRAQAQEQQQLKQLATLRQMLVKQRTMLRNFHHAYERVPQPNQAAMALTQAHLDALDGRIAAVEAEQDALVEAAFAQVRELVLSITGIGRETMVLLIADLGDLSQFSDAKQVSAFVGLNPKLWESGQYKGQVHISKQGHKRLRQVLYMGAHAAAQWNPACKALFDRLLARGRHRKVAYVAVANKLLRQVVAVVQSGQPYQADYEQKRTRAT